MKIYFRLNTALFFSIFTLFSCKNSRNVENNQINNLTYEIDTTYHTYSTNMSGKTTGGIDLHFFDSTISVIYNYCGENQLKIFKPLTNEFDVIAVKTNCTKFYSKETLDKYYTLTNDGNLLCFLKNKQNIYSIPLFNKNIKKDSILFNLGLDIEQYKPGSGMHVNVSDSVFYFRVMRGFDNNKGDYSNKNSGFPIFCKYNLITDKFRLFGKQPKYVENSWYGLASNIYDLFIGDSIITSESINGKINIINTLNNKTKEIKVKSKFDTIAFEMFDFPKNGENAKSLKMQHFIESPLYDPLYYNPFTKCYYRVFHPAMPKYNEEGLLNTVYDKKCILMIFDHDLKLLDEFILPIKRMQAFQLIPTFDGIEICLPDLYKYENNETIYSFLKVKHSKK